MLRVCGVRSKILSQTPSQALRSETSGPASVLRSGRNLNLLSVTVKFGRNRDWRGYLRLETAGGGEEVLCAYILASQENQRAVLSLNLGEVLTQNDLYTFFQ